MVAPLPLVPVPLSTREDHSHVLSSLGRLMKATMLVPVQLALVRPAGPR
jgi:hypothetical protein